MSAINFKDFLYLKAVDGGKTFGDVHKEALEATRKNTDFFNNLVGTPKSVVGDNITFEWSGYTKNAIFKNENLTGRDPIVSRQVFKKPDDYFTHSYTVSNLAKREAIDWGTYLSKENEKINDSISLVNNLMIYKAVVDYCIATGAVRVLEKIVNQAATKEEKINDLKNIANVMDVITYNITQYNLGQDSSKVVTLLSPKAYREASFSFQVFNGSDSAFLQSESGEFSMFQGYKFKKVPQLGQLVNPNVAVDYAQKPFDFSKIIGLTFSLDSLAIFVDEPIWETIPNGAQSYLTNVVWRILSVVRPSSSHLNMVYMEAFPSLTDINAKRAELIEAKNGQPFAYAGANLPGASLNVMIEQEQKNLAKNAKAYDVAMPINLKA